MGQATRLTLFDAAEHARWLTDRKHVTHHVYRAGTMKQVKGLAGIPAVVSRFFVLPEGTAPPDGAFLVTSVFFSEKRESDSTRGRDAC